MCVWQVHPGPSSQINAGPLVASGPGPPLGGSGGRARDEWVCHSMRKKGHWVSSKPAQSHSASMRRRRSPGPPITGSGALFGGTCGPNALVPASPRRPSWTHEGLRGLPLARGEMGTGRPNALVPASSGRLSWTREGRRGLPFNSWRKGHGSPQRCAAAAWAPRRELGQQQDWLGQQQDWRVKPTPAITITLWPRSVCPISRTLPENNNATLTSSRRRNLVSHAPSPSLRRWLCGGCAMRSSFASSQ
jgi:hypothetical protein